MDEREANTITRSPNRSGDEMMGRQSPQMMMLMGQKQEKNTPWHVMPVVPNPSTPPSGFDHRRLSWVDEHGPTSCASADATAVPQPAPIAAHAPPPPPPPSAGTCGVTGAAPAPGHAAAAGWPPGSTEQARDGSGDTDSYQRHQHHQHHQHHQQQLQQQQHHDQHRPLQMVPLSAHDERHSSSSRAYSQQHPSQQPYQQPQYLQQQQQPQHQQQHYSPALHHHQSMPNFRTSPMHPGSPASSTGGTPRAQPGPMADRGTPSSHSSHVYRPYNPLEHLPPHASQPRMNNSNFEGAHLASAIGSDDRFSTVGPARVATVSASMQQPSSGASSRPDEPTIQTLPIQPSAILSASRNSSMQQHHIHGIYQHSYSHSYPQQQQHDTSAVGFSHHVPPTLPMSARSGESPTSRQQQFYPAAAQQVHYVRPSSSSSSSVTSSWSTLSPILDRPYQPNAIASGPTAVYSPSVNQHWGPSSANEFANAGGVFSAAPRYSTYEEGIMAQSGAQYLPIPSGMPVPLLSSPPIPLRPRHSPPSERSTGSDEERKDSTTVCPLLPPFAHVEPMLTYTRPEITQPFISKLSHLLSNEDYHHLIRWNDEGDKFTFAHSSPELLEAFTRIFRHGNIHSFVRQLNIYSFTRLSTMELVECLPSNEDPARVSDYHGFMHPLFFRDSPHRTCDLTKIKPKASKKSAASKGNGNAMFANAPPTPGDKRRSSLSGLSSLVREAASPYAFHPHQPQLQDEQYHRY
ncbi:BZ3500_MvSof-1268-A1-R1_Chr1-2g01330 [Microbotryum saponariae]|uniref:BZ3500_MvSof-1268-A1-R1_Chr1-2g01330 protein n=1 Tax=Microbotryum saponariae TaxID=289078 RepID=A0A2X0KYT2_9BASI|nr:BZ3500_MvSof-1268-A1-R1_Chr1-2g01330 [Microbotryum saponariae]SCZ97116.1 BZ3501_MvSof-1269-A2-R1_Chr1-2g00929 [Microbotryum saponariae]